MHVRFGDTQAHTEMVYEGTENRGKREEDRNGRMVRKRDRPKEKKIVKREKQMKKKKVEDKRREETRRKGMKEGAINKREKEDAGRTEEEGRGR